MFGGFGRSNEQDKPQTPPLHASTMNYAKQAICTLVWQRIEKTNQVKDELYTLKNHFLFPYSGINLKSSSHLNYIKSHNKKRIQRSYEMCVGRALVHCVGLELPEKEQTDEILDEFKEEVRRCDRYKKAVPNAQVCMANEILNGLMIDVKYEEANRQYARSVQSFHTLANMLQRRKLPSEAQVRKQLGEEAALCFRHACDKMENTHVHEWHELDVDELLCEGESRIWTNPISVQKSCNLLHAYVHTFNYHELQDASAYCEQWLKKNTGQNPEARERKRAAAAELNVWRIRSTQLELWRTEFTQRGIDFAHYEHVEKELKEQKRGAYQYVSRRHHSATTVREMFDGGNWARLCAVVDYEPPPEPNV